MSTTRRPGRRRGPEAAISSRSAQSFVRLKKALKNRRPGDREHRDERPVDVFGSGSTSRKGRERSGCGSPSCSRRRRRESCPTRCGSDRPARSRPDPPPTTRHPSGGPRAPHPRETCRRRRSGRRRWCPTWADRIRLTTTPARGTSHRSGSGFVAGARRRRRAEHDGAALRSPRRECRSRRGRHRRTSGNSRVAACRAGNRAASSSTSAMHLAPRSPPDSGIAPDVRDQPSIASSSPHRRRRARSIVSSRVGIIFRPAS